MVNHRWAPILGLVFASFARSSQAAMLPYRLDCDSGKGSPQTMQGHEVTVRLIPKDGACHVEVSSIQGGLLLEDTSRGMQVSPALDLTGDGRRFLLVQADSTPYKLSILSLGPHPGIFATVENGYGFWIQNGCADGRWHIWTADAAFQGDPELADVYHGDLLTPEVVLDPNGNKFVDATPTCKPYFDHRVALLRASLTPQKIAAFRSGRIKDTFQSGEVKGSILGVVFAKLYMGDEAAAHDILREMWPTGDQERVWQWMLRKRKEGLLSHLQRPTTLLPQS